MRALCALFVLVTLSALPRTYSVAVRGAGFPPRSEAVAALLANAEDQWIEEAQRVLLAQTKDSVARENVRTSCVKMADSIADGVQWQRKKVGAQLQRVCKSEAMTWQTRIDLCNALSDGMDTSLGDRARSGNDKVDFSNACMDLYNTKIMAEAEKRYSRDDKRAGNVKDDEQRDKELLARSEHEMNKISKEGSDKQKADAMEKLQEEAADRSRAAQDDEVEERFAEKRDGNRGLAAQLAAEDQEQKGAQADVIDDALTPLSSETMDDDEVLEEYPAQKSTEAKDAEMAFAQA